VAFERYLAHPKRREERAKLLAMLLSNLGVASIIAGLIAPTFAQIGSWQDSVGGVLIGLTLHFGGQSVLHYVVAEETSP
jgi:hypothetical protein